METKIKKYPQPRYNKCNAGHTLTEIYNEQRHSFYWDCEICIKKMQEASNENS